MANQNSLMNPNRSRIIAPLYAIVFHCSQKNSCDYQPALPIDQLPEDTFRTPHMFDPELEQAIQVIRFVLFLPPTYSDSVKLSFGGLRFLFESPMTHQIILLPWPAITQEPLKGILNANPPFHWFSHPEILSDLKGFLKEAGMNQGVSPSSELTTDLMLEIWKRVYEECPFNHYGPTNEPFCMDLTRQDIGLSLPAAFIAQRIANSIDYRLTLPRRTMKIEDALEFRAYVLALDTLAQLQEQPANPEERLQSEMARQIEELRLPITVAASGTAPSFRQLARIKEASANTPADLQRRDQILGLLTTHHAISLSGVALQMPEVPIELYSILSKLEEACRVEYVRPQKIWRLIKDLSRRGQFLFEGETSFPILARAKPLQIFSDFPIGLLIPPGASAPLHLCVPTIYRPLTPLTRALQFQFSLGDRIDLSGGFRVLLAECLDLNDKIATLSWQILNVTKTLLNHPSSRCVVDLTRITSPRELAEALSSKQYDVLVLSAHGVYSSEKLMTSLVIGRTPSTLEQIDHLPPIVFLSSCHTAPRGMGAVSVADLLLRKGAQVILGTLVPVRVDRSGILMQRLLLYMEQAVSGNEDIYTLDEALYNALALNAVHDYETMSKRFMKWMASPHPGSGRPIINEFKHQRSPGRLRPYHIYEDTEKVLLEIATETGDDKWIRAQLSSPGFFPETAFYTLIGNADNIILQLTDFQKKYVSVASTAGD